MANQQPCQFDEATLLNYLRNAVPADVRQTIEQSPSCLGAAKQLADETRRLMPFLREAVCPEIDTLIDYQEGRITGTPRLVIHRHVQRCQQCQAELAMFGAIDAVPNVDQPSFLRRVVEALFQAPTLSAAPVRGNVIFYRTPQIAIHLYSIKSPGKARTWILQGLLRSAEDQPFTQSEDILLVNLDEPAEPAQHAAREAAGTFSFSELEAGRYRLQVITPEEEIFIREIEIGYSA